MHYLSVGCSQLVGHDQNRLSIMYLPASNRTHAKGPQKGSSYNSTLPLLPWLLRLQTKTDRALVQHSFPHCGRSLGCGIHNLPHWKPSCLKPRLSSCIVLSNLIPYYKEEPRPRDQERISKAHVKGEVL
eukprot:864971-Pelagomonas_calceolata.AAC.1